MKHLSFGWNRFTPCMEIIPAMRHWKLAPLCGAGLSFWFPRIPIIGASLFDIAYLTGSHLQISIIIDR